MHSWSTSQQQYPRAISKLIYVLLLYLQFEDCTFDWLYWPQSRKPYTPETIAYIKSLDAEQDIALLKSYGLDVPLECARTLRISTMLLKKGVERGLTPFAIGSIMCRENINKESAIEQIVEEAQDSLLPGMSEAAFIQSISEVLDPWLDKLTNWNCLVLFQPQKKYKK